MTLARFRFHGDLGRFLKREHRERSFMQGSHYARMRAALGDLLGA